MAQATLKNQLKIVASSSAILSNQKKIMRTQEQLRAILGNQEKIIRNQQGILKNQKKILADHAARFRELSKRK